MTEEQVIALLAMWFKATLTGEGIEITDEQSASLADKFLHRIYGSMNELTAQMTGGSRV